MLTSLRGRVGDLLQGPALAVRVLSVLDPADEAFAAEGIGVPDGQRSVVVASTVINVGARTYLDPADLGLAVVDEHGRRHGRAVATLSRYPRFRHPALATGDTVSGHSYFVLPRDAVLAAITWSDPEGTLLTWRP